MKNTMKLLLTAALALAAAPVWADDGETTEDRGVEQGAVAPTPEAAETGSGGREPGASPKGANDYAADRLALEKDAEERFVHEIWTAP